jgi:hypothetical protein
MNDTARLDPDGPRSLSLSNLSDHLTGPLAAGAQLEPIALDATGQALVTWEREPFLLVCLDVDLLAAGLDVAVTIAPPGPGGALAATASLHFAPFTERGATLAIWPFGTGSPALAAAAVTVAARSSGSGDDADLPPDQVAASVSLLLAEGLTARVAYLMGAEKAALRCTAREVNSARSLALARGGSLDRHGADLGVARFTDRLVGTAGPPPQIFTAPRLEPDGREPDQDYRRRLAAMRSWAVPTAAGLAEAVNGPGSPGDPPAGWLAGLGGTVRVEIVEQTNPLAIGVLLIPTGGTGPRDNFLAALRRDRLVRAVSSAQADADVTARMLTDDQRADLAALRTQLAAGYTFGGAAASDPALSDGLARGLVLAAQVRAALGDTTTWAITRVQDSAGGARYELGLGCDVVLPAASQAEQLRAAAAAWHRGPATPDALAGVLAAASAAASASGPDPSLKWLLQVCGLRTIVPADATATFLSTLPMLGLQVTGPASVAPRGWNQVAGLRTATRTLVRYDRTQPVLQLAQIADDASAFIVAAIATPPDLDELVPVGLRGSHDDLGVIVGYQRAAGTLQILQPQGGALSLVASLPNFGSSWTDLVVGDFGGPTDYYDLLFYERASGTCSIYGLTSSFSVLPTVPATPSLGSASPAVSQRIGRWSQLTVIPGTGGPDSILCYDRERGDAQLVQPDATGVLRTRWLRSGWQPGLTHVLAVPAGRAGGTLLVGYDREQGGIRVVGDPEGGTLVQLQSLTLPARAVTHLTFMPTESGGAIVAYDRTGGLAGVWPLPLTGSAGPEPTASAPGPGAIVMPSATWSANTSATVSASLTGTDGGGATGHAALIQGLDSSAAAWLARGGAPWTVVLDRTQQQAIWTTATALGPVATVLTQIGLPGADPASFATSMNAIPAEYAATIVLPAAVADQWRAGAGVRLGQSLVDVLATHGLASAVGLVTANSIALVVAVTGLPGAGLNLSGRASAGYRWYCLPVRGLPGRVTAVGAATAFQPAEEGLCALVVLGYQRAGLADPYEILLDLPDGAALTLDQYEFLLNVAERAVPAGIQVNTLALRQRHLDLQPDGQPDPLPPVASHLYRRFRRLGR